MGSRKINSLAIDQQPGHSLVNLINFHLNATYLLRPHKTSIPHLQTSCCKFPSSPWRLLPLLNVVFGAQLRCWHMNVLLLFLVCGSIQFWDGGRGFNEELLDGILFLFIPFRANWLDFLLGQQRFRQWHWICSTVHRRRCGLSDFRWRQRWWWWGRHYHLHHHHITHLAIMFSVVLSKKLELSCPPVCLFSATLFTTFRIRGINFDFHFHAETFCSSV